MKGILEIVFFLIMIYHTQLSSVSCERIKCQDHYLAKSGFNSTKNLQFLRQRMNQYNFQVYILPYGDQHGSHFLNDEDKLLQYLTGFTGSAGVAVVTDKTAAFFTDGRYTVQADRELDCQWKLIIYQEEISLISWIKVNAPANSKVAADARLISKSWWLEINEALESGGHKFLPQRSNIIDEMWPKSERPKIERSRSRLFIHDIQYSGQGWEDKVDLVIKEIEKIGANAIVLSSLEEIAWLLNLRGSENPFTPTFKSYVYINTSRNTVLYVDLEKVTDSVLHHLGAVNCTRRICCDIRPYEDFLSDLQMRGVASTAKIYVPEETNFACFAMIPEVHKVSGPSPVAPMKAVKNAIEIRGMKEAHIRDALAYIETIAAVEKDLKSTTYSKNSTAARWDELSVAQLMTENRRKLDRNRGESFQTISCVGKNAALPHYTPSNTTCRLLSLDEVFLVDSGGQYLDGTTDVTRTFYFGANPPDIVREAYTRVLMGMIDMSTLTFPSGWKDSSLSDIIARRYLLDVGMEYEHGTGHGIGDFLDVHENSIRIGSGNGKGLSMREGMVTSIEPGFYYRGKFGIRIENDVLTIKASLGSDAKRTPTCCRGSSGVNDSQLSPAPVVTAPFPFTPSKPFLTFETLTLIPLEPALIKLELLTYRHRKWINDYNHRIRGIVGKELKSMGKNDALKWMLDKTQSIPDDACRMSQVVSSSSTGSLSRSGLKGKNLLHTSHLILVIITSVYLFGRIHFISIT